MFPLLPWEAEMLKPLWLIIFGLCGRKSGDGITLVCGIWQNETVWFTCERVLHTLQGDTECHVAGLEVPVRPFPLPTFLKSRRQSPSLVFPMAPMSLAVFFFFLWVKCWWIPCSSHRSKRGSNGLDYDSKRWLWGHCLDMAGSSEQPQPLPPLVSLFLFSPVRHCVSSGPSLLMESR